jgi:hypothetical protein
MKWQFRRTQHRGARTTLDIARARPSHFNICKAQRSLMDFEGARAASTPELSKPRRNELPPFISIKLEEKPLSWPSKPKLERPSQVSFTTVARTAHYSR